MASPALAPAPVPVAAAVAPPAAVPSPGPLSAPAVPSVAATLPLSMPEAWIEQVRTAVKADQHSLVIQLLANSVLAAVIAAGSSLCAAWMTNLEIAKSQILVQRTEDDAVRASYDQLGANLGKLRQQFSGTALLIDIARSTNTLKSRSTEEHLREQFVALGLTEGAIQGLRTDARLDQEVWNQVDKSIADITAAIVSVDPQDPDFNSFTQGADRIEGELAKAIAGVQSAKSRVGSVRVPKPLLF